MKSVMLPAVPGRLLPGRLPVRLGHAAASETLACHQAHTTCTTQALTPNKPLMLGESYEFENN